MGVQPPRRTDPSLHAAPHLVHHVEQVLREEIAEGTVEAGFLERNTPRESKFRLLRPDELAPALKEYR